MPELLGAVILVFGDSLWTAPSRNRKLEWFALRHEWNMKLITRLLLIWITSH